mgnify:CR=1 FL=1
MRPLLLDDREARSRILGQPPERWTSAQRALFESNYRLTVWWGGNGIGKSIALAELCRRALAGRLHWQQPGRPYTVILAGNTRAQIGATLDYFWKGLDKRWFKKSLRFEAGTIQGQRLTVYDVVGGPGVGGVLRCGTFDAENLAGPRADVVITDEPLPEKVHNELWPRLFGRNGRMYEAFTTTLGTAHKVEYLWDLVDSTDRPWAGEIQTELTVEAVTPRGGVWEIPWMTAQEIREAEAGLSAVEADMRMGRTRNPRRDTAYFTGWGPHLIGECSPPAGSRVAVGIDHGSKPGAQRAVLVAVAGSGIMAQVYVLDEYQGEGRTESEEDAQGIIDVVTRCGLQLSDVDLWVGDRAHHGDWRGGKKSNERLKQAIAKALGGDVGRTGWSALLPAPLRRMWTPRKYDRSMYEGMEILHRLMVGKPPRLRISPRCRHLPESFAKWEGSTTDPLKDGLDAARYAIVPLIEGERR